jgi:hypothetical protein
MYLMRILGLILLSLAILVIAGCTTTTGIYKNDIMVQEQPILTRTNPYTDSSTSIRFYLRNYGRDTVPKAFVNFFDFHGMEHSLTCQGGSQVDDHTCEFTNIPSFENRFVSFTIYTPSDIPAPTSFVISYEISFDYSGSRRIIIPVIDDMQESEPKNKYSISDPSVGPIAVDFEPPIGAEKQQGDQTVTEYWGVKGDSFEVRMNFKQAVETSVVTNISASDIKLKLQGLSIDSKLSCDFNSGLTAKSTVSVGQSSVPLSCFFVPTSFSGSEKMTTIDVNFAYTFDTIKTVTFTVVPRQTSEGGTTTEVGNNAEGSSGT